MRCMLDAGHRSNHVATIWAKQATRARSECSFVKAIIQPQTFDIQMMRISLRARFNLNRQQRMNFDC
jgi:hypothetical protein